MSVSLPLALATLWIVHLLAAMSPGQSFLLVSRMALASGLAPAVAAAFGMGAGVMVWAVGAVLGLAVLFEHAKWLYTLIRIAGGLYLIYLAVMVWRHANAPAAMASAEGAAPTALWPGFRDGFLTCLANPKVAVFFGSIFVAVLPPDAPLWINAVILAIVLFNEVAWYAIVALLFSSPAPRSAYLRFKPGIDRAMASVLVLVGIRLIYDVRN